MNNLARKIRDSHRFYTRDVLLREVLLIGTLSAAIYASIHVWGRYDVWPALPLTICYAAFPVAVYGNLIRYSELFVPKGLRTSLESNPGGVTVRIPKSRSVLYFGSFVTIMICFGLVALTASVFPTNWRGSPQLWGILAIPAALVLGQLMSQHRTLVFRPGSVEMFNYLPRRELRVLVDPVEEIRIAPLRSVRGAQSAQWMTSRPRSELPDQDRVFIHIEVALVNSSYFPFALEEVTSVTGRPVVVSKND